MASIDTMPHRIALSSDIIYCASERTHTEIYINSHNIRFMATLSVWIYCFHFKSETKTITIICSVFGILKNQNLLNFCMCSLLHKMMIIKRSRILMFQTRTHRDGGIRNNTTLLSIQFEEYDVGSIPFCKEYSFHFKNCKVQINHLIH